MIRHDRRGAGRGGATYPELPPAPHDVTVVVCTCVIVTRYEMVVSEAVDGKTGTGPGEHSSAQKDHKPSQ